MQIPTMQVRNKLLRAVRRSRSPRVAEDGVLPLLQSHRAPAGAMGLNSTSASGGAVPVQSPFVQPCVLRRVSPRLLTEQGD